MALVGGDYQPGDVIDIYTVQAQMEIDVPPDAGPLAVDYTQVQESPNSGEINALIKRDWLTSSVGRWIGNLSAPDDENFIPPWKDLEPKYFPYRDLFEGAGSYQQWYNAQSDADRAIQDEELRSRMSAGDWAHYVAGQFLDPLTVALTIATAGFYGIGKGVPVGKAALRTGTLTAAESTVLESIAQMTDPLRTADQSAISILAGGTFGALVGAGGQALSRHFGKQAQLKQQIFQVFKDEVDLQRAQNGLQNLPVGTYTAKSETPLRSPYRWLLDNPIMRNAQIRLMYSKSPTLSRLVDKLSSNNILKHGDYDGTRYNGPTLNETIKVAQRRGFRLLYDMSADVQKTLRKRGVRLSVDDISFRATRSARRGGTGDPESEINDIGAHFNREMKDWAERGIKQGVLTREVVDAMDNYVPRMYDKQAIIVNWAKWETTIIAHFRTKYPNMTPDELALIPRDIFDKINSLKTHELMPNKFVPHSKQRGVVAGQLKGRELDIKDINLEDFLINDLRVISNRYIMGAGSDIMLREQFGADNLLEVQGILVPKADYERGMKELTDQADALKRTGKKSDLRKAKAMEEEIEDIQKSIVHYMRSIMHRPVPSKSPKLVDLGKGLRGYAAAAQLGEVVVSAVPDAANNILQYGLTNLMLALPTYFRGLPQVFKRAGAKGRVAQHWREMDVALDNLLSTHILAIADIEDAHLYGVTRGFLHGSEVARKAFRIFLADRWNTSAKLLAAAVAEQSILRSAGKLAKGTLGKHKAAKMHRIGMNKAVAQRIAANVKQYGKSNGLANVDQWDDMTRGELTRMIFRESETNVVMPDAGEMPEIFDSEPGRMLMQFRTFIVSHTMKQLMPAGQRLLAGDLRVMAGLTAMASLGVMSEFVKQVVRNNFDVDKVANEWSKKNAMDIVAIGLDKGAVLSYIPNVLGVLDNVFNGKLGEAVGLTPRANAYRGRFGIDESIPSLGYLGTVGVAGYEATRGMLPEDLGGNEFTAKDLNKVRRSIPFQNTFYLAWLFNFGEDTIADQFDLPAKAGDSTSPTYKL